MCPPKIDQAGFTKWLLELTLARDDTREGWIHTGRILRRDPAELARQAQLMRADAQRDIRDEAMIAAHNLYPRDDARAAAMLNGEISAAQLRARLTALNKY
jgi:hypothetical protein